MLLTGASGLLLAYGFWERFRLNRRRDPIPIRVHVNGTRGKSSVTRLIAAGLRAGGYWTCAKTTGTLPRFIFPDGQESAIQRAGRANIFEQVAFLRQAAALGAEAVVVECMAVNPLLQSLCEREIIKSTHGVITNARPDHLDVMGPTVQDVAKALAGTVPVNGQLFTAERRMASVLAQAAQDRQSGISLIDAAGLVGADSAEMSRFCHIEHPENVALSLAVCCSLGVDVPTALKGMWSAQPDPGALTRHEILEQGKRLVFVNAFAANDPESTDANWRLAASTIKGGLPKDNQLSRIAIVNCRADRPDRTRQMAELCGGWSDLDFAVLTGTGTEIFVRYGAAFGLSGDRLLRWERHSAADVIQQLARRSRQHALIMGIGNVANLGLELVDYVRRRSLKESPCLANFFNGQEAA